MAPPPTCARCLVPILAYEPYAVLEISQRVFREERLAVLDAFAIANICRDCGEQLQLTSPDVDEGEKLSRVALAVPDVQAALDELPPLLLFPQDNPEDPWEQCWGCAVSLGEEDAPVWIECTVTSGRYTEEGTTQGINVLDYYATVCLCEDCCAMVPLPALDSYSHACQWVGAFIWMIGNEGREVE